ncbi:MAG: hypothetical protein BWY68_00922 [bacterium ADurb.Bin400]|nr:MAG: hypothetical protein BWY68_00922 [bacterium ADurb.Bin400]
MKQVAVLWSALAFAALFSLLPAKAERQPREERVSPYRPTINIPPCEGKLEDEFEIKRPDNHAGPAPKPT